MIGNKARRRRCTGFTLIELAVVMTVIALLIAITMPAVMRLRERARQAQCLNNFRQIGVALHNYSTTYGRFPILGGNTPWSVSSAPELGLKPLFDAYDHNCDASTSPVNVELGRCRIDAYRCPSDRDATVEPNRWYVGNVAVNFEILGLSPDHCRDGTTNTAAAVEVASELGLAWITGPALFVGIETSVHAERFTVLFADGSVRALSQAISNDEIRAIGTPNGGEVLNMAW